MLVVKEIVTLLNKNRFWNLIALGLFNNVLTKKNGICHGSLSDFE